MFDVQAIREDFPVLQRQVYGRPLVYLDNAATTQKPRAVIEALVHFYEHHNANIHRAIHALGEEATDAYEETRAKVSRFIGAPQPQTVVFTRNATEALNLVAYSWGRQNLHQGDEILLTEMEHHSNLVPWQRLAQEVGAIVRYIGVTDEGTLALDGLDDLIGERTKLVGVTHVSNAFGTINPVREIAAAAHGRGALVVVDAAQSVPHMPIDVQDLGCDFLAFSGHKMLGPTGVGVLYGRYELLDEMEPFLTGGEMIRRVRLDGASWNEVPWKFEAGTPNIADVIALSAALDYLSALGMDNVRTHEEQLTRYALRRLLQLEDIIVYGPLDASQRGGVISFNHADIHPHDVGTILDREGVAIRAGHHCAQPLMRRFDITGTVRASFYVYNTRDEVDALIEGIGKVRSFFSDAGR